MPISSTSSWVGHTVFGVLGEHYIYCQKLVHYNFTERLAVCRSKDLSPQTQVATVVDYFNRWMEVRGESVCSLLTLDPHVHMHGSTTVARHTVCWELHVLYRYATQY